MVRASGFVFSFFLHAGLVCAALFWSQFGVLPLTHHAFIEVEIVTETMPAPPLGDSPAELEAAESDAVAEKDAGELDVKKSEPASRPEPVRTPPPEPPARSPRPAESVSAVPSPPPAPEYVRTVLPLSKQPPPKLISPEKSPDAPKLQAVEPVLSDHMHLGGGSGTQDFMKHGAEARFGGVDKLFAEKFQEESFVGQYQTNHKRSVSIIDARDTYGRLFIYDPNTDMLRALKQTDLNRFIYTYGPETFVDEPVQGSVTFLPGEKHINRFIWMPADGTAEFPNRIEFDEREVSFESKGATLKGTLIKPVTSGKHPAVVWLHDETCASRFAFHGFARMLALKGVAVLVFDARGCGDSGGDYRTATVTDMAQDALAAVRLLRCEKGIDSARVGLWGQEAGALAAVRAARLSRDPGFVVAAFGAVAPVSDAVPPVEKEIDALGCDVLWVLSGPNPEKVWARRADMLRAMRDEGRPFTVAQVVLRPAHEGVVSGDDPDPLKRLSPWYMENAVPWILER